MSISLVNVCYNTTGKREVPSSQWLVFILKSHSLFKVLHGSLRAFRVPIINLKYCYEQVFRSMSQKKKEHKHVKRVGNCVS